MSKQIGKTKGFVTIFFLMNLICMSSFAQLTDQNNRYKEMDILGDGTTRFVFSDKVLGEGKRIPDSSKTIYLFSGLGADYRVFQNLELAGYHKVFIQWLAPEKQESIEHYAGRIKQQITTKDPLFVGVSFGGMLAIEVAKLMTVDKIVLISSAKTKQDLNAEDNFFLRYRLYKIVPASLLRKSNFMVNYLFGVHLPSDKLLLSRILADTDIHFFKWAMDRILAWSNETIPLQLIHIHGTSDHIIRYESLTADYTIEGGGHFMVLNRAGLINTIILNYFATHNGEKN